MEDHYFTISEARSLLPKVRGLTEEMVFLARHLYDFHPQIRRLAERGGENTGSPEGTRYLTVLLQMQDRVSRIQRLGCVVNGVGAAVENVRTIRFCATIAPVTRACSNFDSMNRGILNHRFKKFDLRDFLSAPSLIYDTAGTGGYMNGL